MPESPVGRCPHCNDELISGKLYCANCGQPVVPADQRTAIDSYITSRVAQEVALKTQGETAIVRDIAFKAEDEVWKRLKRYGWIVGLFIVLLGVIGFGSIQDAKQKIVDEAKSRVEPVVKDVEKRAQAAQNQIGSVEKRIPEITLSLNKTALLADEQRKRIEGQAAEIAAKLKAFDAAVDRANKMGANFETTVSSTQKRFDDATRRFDTQLTQVTKAVTRTAVSEAFPSLGQEPYVQIGNIRPDRTEKKPNEKWVNVYVTGYAMQSGTVSSKKLEELSSELQAAGFMPILGLITFGGRMGGVMERVDTGSQTESAVIYFRKEFKPSADILATILKKYVSISPLSPALSDLTRINTFFKLRYDLLIRDGKLDAQIFISAPI